jgi:2-octaprenyl-6-methoxyphenol hydroxylase
MHASDRNFDVIIVGGGPAGLAATLALARHDARIALIAPKPAHPDRRTTALLGSSVDTLRRIGVWPAIEASAAPLRKLRLVDGTRRLVRSPEVLFGSEEIGLDAFGYNIANEELLSALRSAIVEQRKLTTFEQAAARIRLDDNHANVELADGSMLTTKLVVAADGRNSICRQAAGIRTSKRDLPQFAIALNLVHTRSHHDISTEFHTESGPFTLVPLAGNRSSLVWVCTGKDAERIRSTSDDDLSREIEKKSHHILGETRVEGPRGIFPLGVEIAECFAARRVALVGESGHVIPPIGAQGLNLGIRDAEGIAKLAGEALDAGSDPGSEAVLAAYDLERRSDVRTRAVAVEMLGRSLLTEFLPVHLARGIGLELASRIPFLRRNLMQTGLGMRQNTSLEAKSV